MIVLVQLWGLQKKGPLYIFKNLSFSVVLELNNKGDENRYF